MADKDICASCGLTHARHACPRVPIAVDVIPRLDAWIKANVAIRCIVETRWSSTDWPRVQVILRELLIARIEMERSPWWS